MNGLMGGTALRGVLVTDFDGTMTEEDFYRIVLSRFAPADAAAHWDAYREGRLTHFEALEKIFSGIRAETSALTAAVSDMRMDPGAREAISRLAAAGWAVVIASAGCDWYIKTLLASQRIPWTDTLPWNRPGPDGTVTLLANTGRYSPESGLTMFRHASSTYRNNATGTDKEGVVADALQRAPAVAFAGDGPPDAAPAMMMEPARRFARGWLADHFVERGVAFWSFSAWSEIVRQLLDERAR